MRSYTVKTHADREFDHDFYYVSVVNTSYEGNGKIQILNTEVDESNENRYQRELDDDNAVISWVCDDVE